MDVFTLAIFIILTMIALNQQNPWLAAGLLIVLVFTMHSRGLIALVIIGLVLGFMTGMPILVMWGLLVAIFIVSFLIQQGGTGPGAYSPTALMGG